MQRNNRRSLNIAAVLAAACLAGPAWASDPVAENQPTATADEMEEITVVGNKTGKQRKKVRSADIASPKPDRAHWQFFPAYEPAPAGHRFATQSHYHFERRESITLFRLSFGR